MNGDGRCDDCGGELGGTWYVKEEAGVKQQYHEDCAPDGATKQQMILE